MFMWLLLLVTVFYASLACVVSERCFADAQSQLERAESYEKNGDYEQAEMLYQEIVADYPDADHALLAQKNLVVVYYETGRLIESDQTFNRLRTEFSSNPELPSALASIAREYDLLKDFAESERVYRKIVNDYPNISLALRAQKEVALMCIRQNKVLAHELNKLISLHQQQGSLDLAHALFEIGQQYEEDPEKLNQATDIYRRVVEAHSDLDGFYAGRARLSIPKCKILSYIKAGKHGEVLPAVDEMLENFRGEEFLPEVILDIGRRYRDKGFRCEQEGFDDEAEKFLGKAIPIWKRVIEEWPDTEDAADAYFFSAVCYESLGEQEMARDHYKKIIANWPKYRAAGKIQFMLEHGVKDVHLQECRAAR